MRAMIMGTGKYEGLEVVAYQSLDATRGGGWMAHKHALPQSHIDQGALQEPLCRLSDAPRAIAELREECERLRMQLAACGVVALANTPESASEARQMHPDYMSASCSDVADAVDREITLRQQLAERDAEIERLRVKLMTIASAEPGRHNIEWAKAMAATGNNEAYAKWREAFDQRDKLAGLLRDERNWSCVEISCQRGVKDHCLCGTCRILRIDAALAEVKPCPESPAPTT